MQLNSLLTLSFIATMALVGCGGGGGGSTTITDPISSDVNVSIIGDYQVESLGSANTINATVSLGNTVKSLYLVLSNSDTASGTSTITHNAKVTEVAQFKSILPTGYVEKPVIFHHPQYVQDFSSQMGTLLSKTVSNQLQAKTLAIPERLEDVEGRSNIFYLDADGTQTTNATARKVISNITTKFGAKTLNIWVSDDSFGVGCSKSKCVTQDMVDALADTFLLDGFDNDIYDWVTNIYGEEWDNAAEAKYSNLIPADDEITILLTDIPNSSAPVYDTPDGGIIGFFWSKDNFDNFDIGGSNERVMFYADAVMFANGGDDNIWTFDDSWPKEMVSTLAHEFQHMINFYQKRILLNADADTWIKEMLSESTEDLVATKIRHTGPRGVDYLDGSAGEANNPYGRYPLFNANNTLSLTIGSGPLDSNGNPTFALADYSKVNAFGAYLLRNYGGAELLHNIMHNSFENEQAVVDAVNKSPEGSGKIFANLLSEWGVAVILSDHESLVDVPFYNTGDFTYSNYTGIEYDLGSINFFNYILLDQLGNIIQDGPKINKTEGTIAAQGNYYYEIGENLTGDINITLELNGQTEATLIAK